MLSSNAKRAILSVHIWNKNEKQQKSQWGIKKILYWNQVKWCAIFVITNTSLAPGVAYRSTFVYVDFTRLYPVCVRNITWLCGLLICWVLTAFSVISCVLLVQLLPPMTVICLLLQDGDMTEGMSSEWGEV